MHDFKPTVSRSQAARETAAGRGFVLWIAAWALLMLSLFIFHDAGL